MKVFTTLDNIAKAVMASGGLAITALQPLYGSDKWYVAVVAVYGALGVYFTKNLGTTPTPVVPADATVSAKAAAYDALQTKR